MQSSDSSIYAISLLIKWTFKLGSLIQEIDFTDDDFTDDH